MVPARPLGHWSYEYKPQDNFRQAKAQGDSHQTTRPLVPQIEATRQFSPCQVIRWFPPNHLGVGPTNRGHKAVLARPDHKAVSTRPLERWSHESRPQGNIHRVRSQGGSRQDHSSTGPLIKALRQSSPCQITRKFALEHSGINPTSKDNFP